MTTVLKRAAGVLRRQGVRGLAGVAAGRVAERARTLRVTETHIWYALSLQADRPRRAMPADLELIEAGEAELASLRGMNDAPLNRSHGGRLFLVMGGEEPAFSCWIFPTSAPLLAARGGWMTLPRGVVCLEDSVTSAAFRGRGIAPAAWSAIADQLEAAGVEQIVTKVQDINAPSRKAVGKAGFREVAIMHTERRWPRMSVRVEERDGAVAEAEALRRELER